MGKRIPLPACLSHSHSSLAHTSLHLMHEFKRSGRREAGARKCDSLHVICWDVMRCDVFSHSSPASVSVACEVSSDSQFRTVSEQSVPLSYGSGSGIHGRRARGSSGCVCLSAGHAHEVRSNQHPRPTCVSARERASQFREQLHAPSASASAPACALLSRSQVTAAAPAADVAVVAAPVTDVILRLPSSDAVMLVTRRR